MLAVLALVTTALAQPPAATARPLSSLPDREAAAPVAEAPAPPAPAAVAKVRPMLGARHAEDLPSRELLDAQGDAAEALRWLAAHSESLVEAERAALLLSAYEDETTGRFCAELVGGEAHAKIRAGAARCLAGRSLEPIAAVPALLKAAASSDARVGLAAVEALRGDPKALPQLQALPKEGLSVEVQARIAELD
jgi:hypothetical protein